MRPMCRVASSPIFFQVFPPSSDLYAPSPQDELCRLLGSPVPTHTTDGSDGAMAMSPIVETLSLSNTGSQVVPLLVVFQTPPAAAPTYTISGLLSTAAKSSMRPPITPGPISRNSNALNLSIAADSPGAAVFAAAAAVCSLSVSFALDLSFWPPAIPPARIVIPNNTKLIRMHFFNMVPPAERFGRAHRGAAHHTAPAARVQHLIFRKWQPNPFEN